MPSIKRKDPPEAPPAANAVSAIAARRRVAAQASPIPAQDNDDDTTDEPVVHQLTPSNAFSALRGLRRTAVPSPTPARKPESPAAKPAKDRVKAASSVNASPSPNEDGSSLSPAPVRIIQYSSFTLNDRNSRALLNQVLELRLPEGERFMVRGNFGVKVLEGTVSIAGATLRPSDEIHWVYAPHIHAIPVIRTHQDSRLQLHADEKSKGLLKLGRMSPLFSQLWVNDATGAGLAQGKGSTFKMLFTSNDAPKRGLVQELIAHPTWNKKLASLAASAETTKGLITFLCGPKSAGKSTFSKLLVNRLLSRRHASDERVEMSNLPPVAFLDLDPGQPEFGPPGTLSLLCVKRPNLGVPFTHPGISDHAYTVVASHALASVTPSSNPDLYRRCATALYERYSATMSGLSLVINTPGWIQGTGLELLTDLIAGVNPHEVVYMSEEGPAESVDALQEATKQSFTALPSQPAELTARTSAELREMQMMSYFHIASGSVPHQSARLQWTAAPLSVARPWNIAYASTTSLVGILSYDYQAPADLLADSINGMVLAVVLVRSTDAFRNLPREGKTGYPLTSKSPEGLPFIPNPNDVALDPRHSELLGLVLIRGIDPGRRSLQGLSPLTPAQLERVNTVKAPGGVVLVHGNFGCPNWAYTEDSHYSQSKGEAGYDGDGDGDDVPEIVPTPTKDTVAPWVETLQDNQSRPVGSRRWRVRRDLGRG